MNYRQEWAEGDIEAGTLLDAIEELQKEVESLKERLFNRAMEHLDDLSVLVSSDIENQRLRQALEKAATAMWNSEANMDNEAADIEEVLADCKENPNV